MRILYVLEHYHPYIGGSEKLFTDLTTKMAEAGHHVSVVTTKFESSLSEFEEFKGVKIYRVKCFNRYLFTLFAIIRLIRLQGRFDLVHATTYNAAVPAWIYSKIRKIPSVLTFHEVWGKLWFQLPFLNAIQRIGFYVYEQLVLKLRYDHYIAVSESTKSELIKHGVNQERITRIYNGLDYTELEANKDETLKNENYKFLYFGRLGVSKGLDLLIPAFTRIIAKGLTAELTLVLPRKPESFLTQIHKLIEDHNAFANIKIEHELPYPQLIKLISQSNAVVIPSYTEGFCYVAAETGALGTPIVHSGKMSLSEVVSGHHVKMETQNVEGLSDALEKAYNGHWSFSPVRRFEIQDSIEEYLEFYTRIS